jgi:hypothetical protein
VSDKGSVLNPETIISRALAATPMKCYCGPPVFRAPSEWQMCHPCTLAGCRFGQLCKVRALAGNGNDRIHPTPPWVTADEQGK